MDFAVSHSLQLADEEDGEMQSHTEVTNLRQHTRNRFPRSNLENRDRMLGRVFLVLSRLVALFLIFDGAARLALFGPYVEGLAAMGYPTWQGPAIGATLVAWTVLYLVPRTALLGAILTTGYLGGAAAAHVRLEDRWFLFPVGLAAILWGHLYLRDPRLRELLGPGQGR
jgi:hypothetical protein